MTGLLSYPHCCLDFCILFCLISYFTSRYADPLRTQDTSLVCDKHLIWNDWALLLSLDTARVVQFQTTPSCSRTLHPQEQAPGLDCFSTHGISHPLIWPFDHHWAISQPLIWPSDRWWGPPPLLNNTHGLITYQIILLAISPEVPLQGTLLDLVFDFCI